MSPTLKGASVALIGAGNMGLAMLEGWAKEGLSGGDVVVVEPNPSQRLSDLCAVKGFRVAAQPAAGYARDAVILAVKPQALDAGAASAAPFVGPGSVVVSILAGKRIADLSRATAGGEGHCPSHAEYARSDRARHDRRLREFGDQRSRSGRLPTRC